MTHIVPTISQRLVGTTRMPTSIRYAERCCTTDHVEGLTRLANLPMAGSEAIAWCRIEPRIVRSKAERVCYADDALVLCLFDDGK